MKGPTVIHESKKLSRVLEIQLNGKILSTPTYFPAISSYGVKPPFHELLYLLKIAKYPRILVSAYDLYHMRENKRNEALSLMKSYRKTGFLFMDSGLFESWGKNDKKWNITSYKSVLSQAKFDLYSSFDVYRGKGKSHEKFKKDTYNNILKSSVFLNNTAFFAILHESTPFQLINLVNEFAEKHSNLCRNIAVAERDIGKSLQERAETIVALRKAMNNNDCHLLHILGCGNPLSMLVYSYCGADTFDSVDWIKFAINPKKYSTSDFAHLELLNCKCKVCSEQPYARARYLEKLLLHNLLFYQNFVVQIQSLIRNDNLEAYAREYVGEKTIDQIEEY